MPTVDEPGGGKRVRLREPNGYQIEVVCGIAPVAEIPVQRQKLNFGEAPLSRPGELMRLPRGPAHVKRVGHGVLMTPRFRETVAWFRETLGFICSDDVYVEDKDNVIGSFNRCDRGDRYVDHHVFFCLAHEKTGLNHLSFEVSDIDDVCMGHDYLKQFGKYEHMWGIGRHVLGSQVYDYWADPWGHVHEHWADSDRLNVTNGSKSRAGRGSAGVAMGRGAAGKVHQSRQSLTRTHVTDLALGRVDGSLRPRAASPARAGARPGRREVPLISAPARRAHRPDRSPPRHRRRMLRRPW